MTWDYKTTVFDAVWAANCEADLNDVGADGWDLVSVVGNVGKNGNFCSAVLKRQRTA